MVLQHPEICLFSVGSTGKEMGGDFAQIASFQSFSSLHSRNISCALFMYIYTKIFLCRILQNNMIFKSATFGSVFGSNLNSMANFGMFIIKLLKMF